MFYLFKNLKIAYYAISWSILAVFLIIEFWLIFATNTNYFVFLLFIIISWIVTFLNQIVFNIFAAKKYNQIVSILNDECDPIKYLNTYYPLAQQNINAKFKPLVLLNLASGYISVGDYAQAKNVLVSIDLSQAKPFERIFFHCHWTSIFLNEHNFAEAEKALNFISQLVNSSKLKPEQIADVNRIRNLYAARINIEKGCFDGAEQTLNELLRTAEFNYSRISTKYTLAKLYIRQNRIDKAVEAMKYVAENGNTLNIAQKARYYLKSSDNNSET